MNWSLHDLKKHLNNPFVALKNKNFRIYWISMAISLIGTWMQNIAQPWLAYTLTHSPFRLGLVSALQFTPMLFFSLIAGTMVDTYSKKKIIFITQTASLLITMILAFLVWRGHIRYWHLLVSSTALGFVNTLDMPTRQALVAEMVGKADLMNAIALNTSVFNMARILGPAVAGLTMAYFGLASCFLINSLSFGAVLIALLYIQIDDKRPSQPKNSTMLVEIKAGLHYLYQSRLLLQTMLTTAIIGTFAMNFSVLVPVFTREVLGRGEADFGFLMAFTGVGSLVGAMTIAIVSKTGPKQFMLRVVPVILGILLIITGWTRYFLVTGFFLGACGLSFASFSATANSTLQLHSSDQYRGRIISIYTLVFGGLIPIGHLFSGAMSNYFGARIGFTACGLMILLLLLLLHILLRHYPAQTEVTEEQEISAGVPL
jgi:MFS family permease